MLVYSKKKKEKTLSFYEDDEYHLINVLHKKIGDSLKCSFEQKKYNTRIVSLNPLLAEIENEIVESNVSIPSIDLFQAIIKPSHFDWIAQKATELQTNMIIPVLMNRSQSNRDIKLNHVSNIIKNAGMQSNQTNLTKLNPTINSKEMFDLLNNYDYVIVPYEKENNKSLTNLLDKLNYQKNNKIAVVVGPEGGYSEKEINSFSQLKSKYYFVSLTNSILRSETASLYTISVIMDNLQTKINCDGKKCE